MPNPTGTLNADEDHSTRKITNLSHPPVADHDAATKKYVDDNIVTGSVSDIAFAASWNGITNVAPSKNAVYDWAHAIDSDDDGKVNVLDTASGLVKTSALGVVSNAVAKSDYWDTSDFVPSGTGHAHGLVPDPGASAGATRFLREDATWVGVTGTGTVTTTGTPVSGNLSKFSGATSITNADLTGDVTTAGGVATTIATNSVTLAKMATMATDSILGRATTGIGNVETLSALPFAYTGDVTRPVDSNITTIAAGAVTYAKMQALSTVSKLLGSSATTTPVQEITLGTNLTMSGGTLNASGGATPGGSTTQIQFNDAGVFGGDAGLTWDKVGRALTMIGNQNAVTGFLLQNPNTGNNAQAVFIAKNSTSQMVGGMLSTTYSTIGVIGPDTGYFSSNGSGGMYFQTSANAPIKFATNGTGEIARFTNTGILTLGGSQDAGLARNAAGVLEVNTGVAGTFGTLKDDVTNSVTGFQVNGAAGSGKILKGNGTNFVPSTETYAAPGTSGNVLTSDGTNWISAAPSAGGGTTVSVSGSNFTTTSTTGAAVTGLTFNTVANKTYGIHAVLYAESDTTAGLSARLNFTGTDSGNHTFQLSGGTGAGTASLIGQVFGTFPGTAFCTQANITKVLVIDGFYLAGASTGTIIMEVQKLTSGTATIRIGSYMNVTQLT